MSRPSPLVPDLGPYLERAAQLTALGGDALSTARLAHAAGERLLSCALLARTGGLFDPADRERLFAEVAEPELAELAAQFRQTVPAPLELPGVSGHLEEMFVRVLAAYLLQEDPLAAPRPAAWGAALPPGLWRLPAAGRQAHWQAARRCLAADGAPLPPITWATPLVGERWGTEQVLRSWGHTSPDNAVQATEQVIAALSAGWTWTLPPLAALVSRPLILGDLHALPRDHLAVLTGLLEDVTRLFGWTVIGLPGLERQWPEAFEPLTQDTLTLDGQGQGSALPLRPSLERSSVPELAQWVAAAPGHTLVTLSSRASAARLTGLLPGSHLLSSSLCPAHLFDRFNELQERRERGEVLRVVATTLPPAHLGTFDEVWHLTAPLPHLVEAAQLTRGPFHLVHLRDVAVPQDWQARLEATEQLIRRGADLRESDAQLEYDAQTTAEHPEWRRAVAEAREQWRFATVAAELAARPSHSVPVLIPYGPEGQRAAALYQQTGRLTTAALTYVAWLTPSEARRALAQGQAEEGGWALIWTAPYDLQYGLAAELVEQSRQAEE